MDNIQLLDDNVDVDVDLFPQKNNINAIFTVDSEWGKDNKFLTLQLLIQIQGFEDLLFVYYNSEHHELFEKNQSSYLSTYRKRMIELKQEEKQTTTPVFVSWDYKPNGEKMIFEDVLIKTSETLGFSSENLQNIQLNFFSSVVDLYHLFSISFIANLFSKKFKKTNYITKKNAHFGIFRCMNKKIILHDYSGLSKSLKGLLQIFNISHPLKGDELLKKNDMEQSLMNHFEVFLDYAILDVLSLAKVEQEILNIPFASISFFFVIILLFENIFRDLLLDSPPVSKFDCSSDFFF